MVLIPVVLAFSAALAVFSPPELWGLAVVSILGFTAAHELLHVMAFRVFGDRPRVVRRGLSIATIGGEMLLTRAQMLVTLLAPVVVLTPTAGVLLLGGPASRAWGLGGLLVTSTGSPFDIVTARRVLRAPTIWMWRDSEHGFECYSALRTTEPAFGP